MTTISQQAPIAGEGETRIEVSTQRRRECDNCGEPATKLFWYTYINGRRDPRSSMHGRDDCSWCSDAEAYACDECESEVKRVCCPSEMSWGATHTLGSHNARLFLYWCSRHATPAEAAAIMGAKS